MKKIPGYLRQPAFLLLHLSLIVILAGALTTWLTREKGYVKIGERQTVYEFRDDSGNVYGLPEGVTLERFNLIYYPGGEIPRDYVSHLVIGGKRYTVSMNQVVDIYGYRLIQNSYDANGATVLGVSHDPWGLLLVYTGYLMFTVGGLWMLLAKRGRFRSLLRSLSVVTLLFVGAASSSAATIDGVPRASADSLKAKAVVYSGKTVTFNTLCRDVVTKIYGKPVYRGLSPEQTLMSMRLFPDSWKSEKIILVKDKVARDLLNLEGKYASLADLFDAHGEYKVTPLLPKVSDDKRRALEDLDEKVGIILLLYSGDLIKAAPEELPAWRVKAELTYNSVPFGTLLFVVIFIGSFFALGASFGAERLRMVAVAMLWCSLAISVTLMALEWIIGGHIPLSNTFETLQALVLALEVLLLVAARRNALLLGLGMFFTGALALVAHLVEVNPAVTPLMPVLHSRWLSFHVSLVMTSYAFFGFTFILALAALLRPSTEAKMRRMSLAMLYPGVYLLGLGIITGSVWAEVSWGEYWSWDPKETWALVTMVLYAVPLHPYFKSLLQPRFYHLYMLFAILAVAMTYFGVNFLNSMHAYS